MRQPKEMNYHKSGYESDKDQHSESAEEFWQDLIGHLKDAGHLPHLGDLQAQSSARKFREHIDEFPQE